MKAAKKGPTPGVPTFSELSEKVVLIRNVNDHLNRTLQNVAAHGNSPMGTLSWVTFHEGGKDFYTCLIALGTAKKSKWEFVNPAGRDIVLGPLGRTAEIHLATGEHRANLSTIIPEMMRRIESLERDLEETVRKYGLEGQQAGTDFFLQNPCNGKHAGEVLASSSTAKPYPTKKRHCLDTRLNARTPTTKNSNDAYLH